MSTAQVLVALIPVALATVAIVVGAVLEPRRVRRNRRSQGRSGR
jgi:hypothetical protein